MASARDYGHDFREDPFVFSPIQDASSSYGPRLLSHRYRRLAVKVACEHALARVAPRTLAILARSRLERANGATVVPTDRSRNSRSARTAARATSASVLRLKFMM
jgi:hypothetical protein